jgi:hypothetical protein
MRVASEGVVVDVGTQERWCAFRTVREKGSAATGPYRAGAGDSQDHSLLQPGLRVGFLRGSYRLGSVRASLRVWPLIGPGQPTPVARILTPAADTRHSAHPLRLVCVDLQPHRCRRHASLGHWRILVMKKNHCFGLDTMHWQTTRLLRP